MEKRIETKKEAISVLEVGKRGPDDSFCILHEHDLVQNIQVKDFRVDGYACQRPAVFLDASKKKTLPRTPRRMQRVCHPTQPERETTLFSEIPRFASDLPDDTPVTLATATSRQVRP